MKHIETKAIRRNLYTAIDEIEKAQFELEMTIENEDDENEWERSDKLQEMMEDLLNMTTYLEEEFNKEDKISIDPTYYE